jgi:hypothetical protein
MSAQSRDDTTLQERVLGGVSSPSESGGNADISALTLRAITGVINSRLLMEASVAS